VGLSSTCAEVLRPPLDYLDDQITPDAPSACACHMAALPKCQQYEVYQSVFSKRFARLRVEGGAGDRMRERSPEPQGSGLRLLAEGQQKLRGLTRRLSS